MRGEVGSTLSPAVSLEGRVCQLHCSRTTRIIFGLLWIALLVSACGGSRVEPTPYPSEVDWETAVEILNTGEVEMVAQLHSLEVILTLKDGTEIRTVEPTIDAIFQEVQKCSQLCSQIVLGTE